MTGRAMKHLKMTVLAAGALSISACASSIASDEALDKPLGATDDATIIEITGGDVFVNGELQTGEVQIVKTIKTDDEDGARERTVVVLLSDRGDNAIDLLSTGLASIVTDTVAVELDGLDIDIDVDGFEDLAELDGLADTHMTIIQRHATDGEAASHNEHRVRIIRKHSTHETPHQD